MIQVDRCFDHAELNFSATFSSKIGLLVLDLVGYSRLLGVHYFLTSFILSISFIAFTLSIPTFFLRVLGNLCLSGIQACISKEMILWPNMIQWADFSVLP